MVVEREGGWAGCGTGSTAQGRSYNLQRALLAVQSGSCTFKLFAACRAAVELQTHWATSAASGGYEDHSAWLSSCTMPVLPLTGKLLAEVGMGSFPCSRSGAGQSGCPSHRLR